MSKGYYESGLIINDIIRLNIKNLAYFGIGAGTFYNYGYYSSNDQKDNFKFNITGSISF
jgi:hypothetical protein